VKSLSRLGAIVKKEVLQLSRDRLTFGMIFGLPIIQILLFGYAINTDVRNLRTAVANQAGTHLSQQFISELRESQIVKIVDSVASPDALESLLRRGEVSIGVLIPPDFDRRVVDNNRAAVHILVDGSDPTILSVANRLRAMPIAFDSAPKEEKRQDQVEIRPFYNPERRTPVNIVPGLMGVILMMTMMLFTAVAIVRERERGNLELLIATPVSSAELMIGKVIPYIGIGLFQLAIILAFGQGLLISTVTHTQFQAMQVTVFILMPSILLSGFMFPFDGMPQVAQYIGEVLPTTHFIRLTRGIMLREAPIGELSRDFYYLVGFTVVAMTVAAKRFTKRLD